MLRVGNIKIGLQAEAEKAALRSALHKLRITEDQVVSWHVSKRSIDARDKGDVHFVYTLDLELREEKKIFSHLKPGIASLVAPASPLSPVQLSPRASAPVVIGTRESPDFIVRGFYAPDSCITGFLLYLLVSATCLGKIELATDIACTYSFLYGMKACYVFHDVTSGVMPLNPL